MTKAKPIYQAFKMSIGGNHVKRDFVYDLTLDEVLDEKRFPYGVQGDAQGKYVWTHSLMERYITGSTLGKPSRPVPSATTAILGKLASKKG